MSTPSAAVENGPLQHAPAALSNAADAEDDNMSDIPRRLMRVKVLYTFDDQNKSNCLARLPNALRIPTVSLDESTQVGVIELKTCIQAIVAASPELVAKLGHDYTVYAFDFSEYETPLVGQGMLSWILASASSTPNAPAEDSQTMVTGRVCKNILGLFSNGIKETLEVKLKLVPVPTCMQEEYVENMERYHNLSKLMPEGLDYNAWAEFLKANPAIGQLAHPSPEDFSRTNQQNLTGSVESFHQMLARTTTQDNASRIDSFYDQPGMSFNSQGTRASSPAMSTASYQHYQSYQDSRPASRASFRSDTAIQPIHYLSNVDATLEQQEDGPPKKRARVTKAKRPRKTALGVNPDSLRVTASTAASVRLHRPVATNPAAAIASIEQAPRAPTPRPGNASFPQAHVPRRPPAPSLLRHTSMDEGRPYMSPYDSGPFSDIAIDSADDEKGGSPDETSMDIPSSPPLMPHRVASSAPSSPGLPTLPMPADSGFVSDMPLGRDDEEAGASIKAWDGSDLPTVAEAKVRAKPDRSNHPWTTVNPGPVELLPKSYVPKPKTYSRTRSNLSVPDTPGSDLAAVQSNPGNSSAFESNTVGNTFNQTEFIKTSVGRPDNDKHQSALHMSVLPPMDSCPFGQMLPHQQAEPVRHSGTDAGSPNDFMSTTSQAASRSTSPNFPSQPSKQPKARGLPRSHTWSGEPMSDAAMPGDINAVQPRSGSGAKRKQHIKNRMEAAISAGEIPTYCNNCGQIETPTWRKAYTRIEEGVPDDVKLAVEGNGIAAFEVIEPTEDDDGVPKYRVFKQALAPEEKASDMYTALTLCNPCGLWLKKKGSMRPAEKCDEDKMAQATNGDKPKRKRNPPKGPRKKAKGSNDEIASDAAVPHSEPVTGTSIGEATASFDGASDAGIQSAMRGRASSFRPVARLPQITEGSAQAALRRAIQSSPVGFRGSREVPVDIETDLTPKPTRRLLFPSPRKDGETKFLSDSKSSPTARTSASNLAEPTTRLPNADAEDIDKENCPPPGNHDEDDLAHLFEEHVSPKTTPTKASQLQDLLKTPTPGSRRRGPLTPKYGDSSTDLKTPSRSILTPRTSGRAGTIAPETPFTRQLNALMADCIPSSPSQAIDFSAFPTFNTPGRHNNSEGHFTSYLPDDFLSSDMPLPSSPPGGLGFALYEDPNTSTIGLWSGASMFEGSDAILPDADLQQENDEDSDSNQDLTLLKMNGISVDFAAMIQEVVENGNKNPEDMSQSQSQAQGQTPEGVTGAE